MDHEVVVRQKMTERYLLDELDPEVRDEFEEHYFDCPKCAFDVRAGAAFVDQSKAILAEKRATESVPPRPVDPVRLNPGWLAWLRPAFAAPALAILLAVCGYQNVITIPTMANATKNPQVMPWAQLNVNSFGDDEPAVRISPGQGFILFIKIPSLDGYSNRTVNLYNPAGKLEWTIPIPSSTTQGQWPVAVPAAQRVAGTYKVIVRGINAAGTMDAMGQALFELQIQN